MKNNDGLEVSDGTFEGRLRRQQFRSLIQDRLESYVAEGEHQDGEGYWDQFEDVDAVVADFVLFLTALEDT